MGQLLATSRLLVITAARSVLSHRTKSLIVGFILMFGTALLVIGTSLLDSVQESMMKTVTESLAGDLQVYSADAAEQLALFGDVIFGGDDIAEIENFEQISAPIEALENVEAVVPMGILQSRFVMGNRIDEVLGELRQAVDQEDSSQVARLQDQVKEMARALRDENMARIEIASDPAEYEANVAALERALSDKFWAQDLPEDPSEALQFLDTDMAPLASDGQLIFMRVLGTDPQKFARFFERFRVIEGEQIPPGEHGVLISHQAYDKWLKNRVAYALDSIRVELNKEQRRIADDELLQNDVKRMVEQYRRVIFGLTSAEVAEIVERLRAFLGSDSADEKELLQEFLSVTDANFEARYAYFYEQIAPLIQLHEFEVGDVITLQSFTNRGFPQSANVKVWGTFGFQGLEETDLAGSVNIVDLPTFRTLYGVMSAEAQAELDALRESVGLEDIARDDAEAALFGGDDSAFEFEDESSFGGDEDPAARADELGDDALAEEEEEEPGAPVELAPAPPRRSYKEGYNPEELSRGLVRSAAVILKDPTKLAETRQAIETLNVEQGLNLNVLDWQEAAGIIGQFVIVIRLVLYVAITIIFLVALVIINNSMVMATVERTAEIGTMRAIGAQRWYVMALFMLETLILGAISGLVGCALGAGTIFGFQRWGIPATTDFLHFLFAGSRLYPTLSLGNLVWALAAMLAVSLLSTLYPARLATRIQPIVAMRQ